jgi:antitoxin component YwqK of YwqJK toxin-antitoxin module
VYSAKGETLQISHIFKDELNGPYSINFRNGNKNVEGFFKNDSLEGERRWYDSISQKIIGKEQWSNGKRINDWYLYYPAGNLRQYSFYRPKTNKLCQLVSYDSTGNIVYYSGWHLAGRVTVSGNAVMGDSIIYKFSISVPPDDSIRFFFSSTLLKEIHSAERNWTECKIENFSAFYFGKFESSGTYLEGYKIEGVNKKTGQRIFEREDLLPPFVVKSKGLSQ